MLEKKREGGVAYMNDSQESPGEEGSTLKLELLKRIEEMSAFLEQRERVFLSYVASLLQ